MLRRTNNATPTILVNSLMYTDTYTISQLSTTDDGREYQCEVVINTSLLIMATGSIPLGECMQQIISALLNSHVVTLHKNSVWKLFADCYTCICPNMQNLGLYSYLLFWLLLFDIHCDHIAITSSCLLGIQAHVWLHIFLFDWLINASIFGSTFDGEGWHNLKLSAQHLRHHQTDYLTDYSLLTQLAIYILWLRVIFKLLTAFAMVGRPQ